MGTSSLSVLPRRQPWLGRAPAARVLLGTGWCLLASIAAWGQEWVLAALESLCLKGRGRINKQKCPLVERVRI